MSIPLQRDRLTRLGVDPAEVSARIHAALAAGSAVGELLALDRALTWFLTELAGPDRISYRA